MCAHLFIFIPNSAPPSKKPQRKVFKNLKKTKFYHVQLLIQTSSSSSSKQFQNNFQKKKNFKSEKFSKNPKKNDADHRLTTHPHTPLVNKKFVK
ncbi:hypothetical protein L3Y34_016340, partial [Caenorhabditis briggsae]